MHLTFLSARLPLTKTFALQNKQMIATPYPLVSRVTSHQETILTLADFHTQLLKHALLNHCLLSGPVAHPLSDESRAGKGVHEDRWWVCFDFDKVKGKSVEDVIKKYLPAYCHDVSYVAQLSASMFRPDVKTFSGHVFMLLKTPVSEKYLKQWFEHLNLSIPALEHSMTLTDSMQALHWPLDRTVADCTKIIYIAPPICHGFTPKLKPENAITLVKKPKPSLDIQPFEFVTSNDIRQKINTLRRAVGESDLDYNVQAHGNEEVLIGAALCDVHGIRSSGDHYIRFNLNGGDSYAYYIDLRNPLLIRNFKGEPLLKTEEAAPELYKSLKKTAPKTIAAGPLDEETDVLAFYATNKASSIMIGTFEPIQRALTLNSANETSAKAWLSSYSITAKGYLPHINLVFEPTNNLQYIHGSDTINTFCATEYMMLTKSSDKKSTLSEIPPTIQKTMRSMLGNPDEPLFEHFINWLAFIFQKREKTAAAWVLHGRSGTGKSTFISEILTPLFGEKQVRVMQFNAIKADFNGYLEDALFVVFEEANTKAVENQSDLMSKLKHWITDSPIEIRRMRTDNYTADNYTNFIFNSNENTPVSIPGDDRRFNIANRQEEKLFFTPKEIKSLINGDELNEFADFLLRWPANALKARQVIETQAKIDIHEASTSINQLLAEAVQRGDLQFFIDRMPSDSEANSDFYNRFNTLGMFKEHLARYTEAAENGVDVVIRDEDLFVLFRTLIPDTRYFQDSKTWRRRHYKSLGLELDKQHRIKGSASEERTRGMLVKWQKPEYKMPEPKAKLTSIKGGKK